MIPETLGTWVLVIDGTRCRILRRLDPAANGKPADLVLRSENRNLRTMMEQRPTHRIALHGPEAGIFAATGTGRIAPTGETADPVAEDRREFFGQIISLLESHRRAGDFARLIIVSEAEFLGPFMRMMPKALADLVLREVPKNLLHLSSQELAAVVLGEMRDGHDIS